MVILTSLERTQCFQVLELVQRIHEMNYLSGDRKNICPSYSGTSMFGDESEEEN